MSLMCLISVWNGWNGWSCWWCCHRFKAKLPTVRIQEMLRVAKTRNIGRQHGDRKYALFNIQTHTVIWYIQYLYILYIYIHCVYIYILCIYIYCIYIYCVYIYCVYIYTLYIYRSSMRRNLTQSSVGCFWSQYDKVPDQGPTQVWANEGLQLPRPSVNVARMGARILARNSILKDLLARCKNRRPVMSLTVRSKWNWTSMCLSFVS